MLVSVWVGGSTAPVDAFIPPPRFDVPVLLLGAPQFRSLWGPFPDPSAWLPSTYSRFQRVGWTSHEAGLV